MAVRAATSNTFYFLLSVTSEKHQRSILDGRKDGAKQISSNLTGTWSQLDLCIGYASISDGIRITQVQVLGPLFCDCTLRKPASLMIPIGTAWESAAGYR